MVSTAVREDQQAVAKGITTPLNSGVNEGRVTDVQKRIMAGHAGVALLRHRVVLIDHLRRRYSGPATAVPMKISGHCYENLVRNGDWLR
ncbi:hypothetical protein [Streptomyces sp. NPDC020951]|uniref:hypothetical protein n=1 Tax=Streptomyces sp. NPDC020951 TaxID=3365104 RepID=UPI003798EECA